MEEFISIIILTDKNLPSLKAQFEKEIMCAEYDVYEVEWAVGKIIVMQTFVTRDLFDPSVSLDAWNVWLATAEEVSAKFDIPDKIDDPETFTIISRKKYEEK